MASFQQKRAATLTMTTETMMRVRARVRASESSMLCGDGVVLPRRPCGMATTKKELQAMPTLTVVVQRVLKGSPKRQQEG